MKQPYNIEPGSLTRYIIIAVVLAALVAFNYRYLSAYVSSNSLRINDFSPSEDNMSEVRNPAVAGIFYPIDKKLLDTEVKHYLSVNYESKSFAPKIMIVPHAGYQYSGATAAKAYLQLKKHADSIKRVVLVGPSHRVHFKGIATSNKDYFATPLGQIKVDKVADIPIMEDAHKDEHSLEVQLPFLQKTLKDFSIVPIVYGETTTEDLAKVLEPFLKSKSTVIIISADLSHYYDYETARTLDSETAYKIKAKNPDIKEHESCGATGINAALFLARQQGLHPELIDMTNSGDTTGDKSSVVGYGSWAFGEQKVEEEEVVLTPIEQEAKNIKAFAEVYGKDLLKLAQISIEEAVLKGHKFSPSRNGYDDALFDKGASFVTLTTNEKLRGCIGTIIPNQAIVADVVNNAYSAAMEDDRFKPVSKEELKDIKISISLLTDFERVRYENEEDLLNKINAGTDGLVIRDGDRQGLLLPSVWKEIPDKVEFLTQLKFKAGMSPSYWSNKIKIYRFRTVEIKKYED